MRLKDKLKRLPQQAERARSGPFPPIEAFRDPAASGASRGDSPARLLIELREKMDALLGQQKVEREPRPIAEIDSVDYGSGPFLHRRRLLEVEHRVGEVAVSPALGVSGGALSLLALDPQLEDVDFRRALFFDTETTGLGGGTGCYAFLVGLGQFAADGRFQVEQLMIEGPEQERAMLVCLSERLRDCSALVSFNGKSFDWPMIRTRCVMNHLQVPAVPPHLDLLHVTRRLHQHRLASCTLKAVEAGTLGFIRRGDIDGAEVAQRYLHYLRSGDGEPLSVVLEHNCWDVVSMAALVGLYGDAATHLNGPDLVALARTLRRAKAWAPAISAAHRAVEECGSSLALSTRAEIRKALGERILALADFEAAESLTRSAVWRLEISKLYEHTLREPRRALEVALQGTGEGAEAWERRLARLKRKAARSP